LTSTFVVDSRAASLPDVRAAAAARLTADAAVSSTIALASPPPAPTLISHARDLQRSAAVTIKITPNDRGNPPGKLADAELHFADGDGPLEGLKLIGFSIWERRGGNGRNVTFPARQYAVNGERRTFSLLRPLADPAAQEKLRGLILDAYQEFEERAAVAS
jgi:hypothetical protein